MHVRKQHESLPATALGTQEWKGRASLVHLSRVIGLVGPVEM
jgi:hypothetical protein